MERVRTPRIGAGVVLAAYLALAAATLGLVAPAAAHAVTARLGPETSAPPAGGEPMRSAGTSTASSTNWGGYVVSTANNTVSDVKGSWVVPKFKGTCGGAYNLSEAAFWVGIDGYSSSTVEQIGTSIECSSVLYVSSVSYYAWYEFYPAGSVTISMTISPGDHITAQVSYSATYSSYTLSIKDTTTGKSYSTSSSTVTASRSSAEWIAEAPSTLLGILPLVDFGSVHFTSCAATISGHPHAIGGFSNIRLTMVNSAGSANKAVPGGLTSGGAAFSVTWKSYGP